MLSLLALAFFSTASAQDGGPEINSQLFHATVDGNRTLWTDDATKAEPGTVHARALVSYTNQPFVVYSSSDDSNRIVLVRDVLQTDLIAGYTLGPVRLGVDLPVYLLTTGDLGKGGTALGDLAIDGKVTALDNGPGLGLAFAGRALLNTAGTDLPLREQGVRGELSAIVDYEVDQWAFAANLGARFNPNLSLDNVELGDHVFARLAGSYAFTDDAGAAVEFIGHQHLSASVSNAASTPIEAMASGWLRVHPSLTVRAGAGTGLTTGIGSPVFRGILGVAYAPSADKDTDGDGISDRLDGCPSEPEDLDGFDDGNGCPDLDNDSDGIADADDTCPDVAEDMDGFEDTDGCAEDRAPVRIIAQTPEGTVISGASVAIDDTSHTGSGPIPPLGAGAYSATVSAEGFEAADTTFEVAGDAPVEHVVVLQPAIPMGAIKLVVLNVDASPIEGAEWSANGGPWQPVTPEPAAMAPGDVTVRVRAEGFAPSQMDTEVTDGEKANVLVMLQASRVEVQDGRIDLREKVFFDTGRATIKAASFPLLDEVASVLDQHPEIRRIRVEGHTDSRGSAASNLTLSQRRADSVRTYLISQGVDSTRIEAAGFGESRPLDDREVAEAWERNRRVEIFIIDRE